MIAVGDRYRSDEALPVDIWLAIGAPVSMFGDGILPAGEVFIVTDLEIYGRVCCVPENYDDLHDHFVSPEERAEVNRAYFNQYEGYTLLIPADVITSTCKKLSSQSPAADAE